MALIFDYDAFGTTFTNAYLRITNVNYRYEKMSNDNTQPAQTNLDMQYSIWVGEAQEDAGQGFIPDDAVNTSAATGSDTTAPADDSLPDAPPAP